MGCGVSVEPFRIKVDVLFSLKNFFLKCFCLKKKFLKIKMYFLKKKNFKTAFQKETVI